MCMLPYAGGEIVEGVRMKFAAVDYHHYQRGADDEHPRADEPAQRRQSEVISTQAHIEVASSVGDQFGALLSVFLVFFHPILAARRRAYHHAGVVV